MVSLTECLSPVVVSFCDELTETAEVNCHSDFDLEEDNLEVPGVGKYFRNKMAFDAGSYDNRFMGDLVAFVAGDKFQSMFENFFVTHALEFDYEEEHKLKYYELYQKFHDMFERQLDIFCDSVGVSQAE